MHEYVIVASHFSSTFATCLSSSMHHVNTLSYVRASSFQPPSQICCYLSLSRSIFLSRSISPAHTFFLVNAPYQVHQHFICAKNDVLFKSLTRNTTKYFIAILHGRLAFRQRYRIIRVGKLTQVSFREEEVFPWWN